MAVTIMELKSNAVIGFMRALVLSCTKPEQSWSCEITKNKAVKVLMKDFIFDSWWWLQTRFPASLSNVAFPIWSHSTMDFLALSQLVLYQLRSSIVGVKKKRRRKKSQNSKFTRTIITGWIYYFWWIYRHLFRCQTNIPFSLSTPSHVKASFMHHSCNEVLAVVQTSTNSQSMVIVVLSSVEKGQTITHKLYDWKVCHDELSDWFTYGSDR